MGGIGFSESALKSEWTVQSALGSFGMANPKSKLGRMLYSLTRPRLQLGSRKFLINETEATRRGLLAVTRPLSIPVNGKRSFETWFLLRVLQDMDRYDTEIWLVAEHMKNQKIGIAVWRKPHPLTQAL